MDQGLAVAAARAYVARMQFFARLSPFRAVRDLRLFLHQRQKHELFFLFLSVFMTGLLLIGFAKDSKVEKSSGFKNLDKAAIKSLSACKFKPGSKDGSPAETWTKVDYAWKLD